MTVTPKEIMIAMSSNGGIALGAFKNGEMLGFSIAFPGFSNGKAYMYSHMTGVAREHQSKGIGYLLKRKQRKIAIERGFDLAAWTFDPLIGLNAHFNFSKLGVISRTYFLDYYGAMKDSINYGWATDRFFAESFLKNDVVPQIRARVRQQLKEAHSAVKTTELESYLQCNDWEVDLRNPVSLIDIPRDIVRIKGVNIEDAKRWRLATRELFRAYFGGGFTALDLVRRGRDFSYVLSRVRIPRAIEPTHS